MGEWEKTGKDIYANVKQKRTGMATSISEKADFRTKKIIRDERGYFLMIKVSIHQDVTTLKCMPMYLTIYNVNFM